MDNVDMKKPEVVFIGHVVIDHNKVEQTSYIRWGSPAMFMMRYFRTNFAVVPTIIASYGKDFLRYANDVKLLPHKPNVDQTIVYENIVADGHRTQYCHGGNAPLPDISPDIEAVLSKADILVLAPLTPAYTLAYVAKLMEFVPDNCLKVLLPQGYLRHIDDDDLVEPRDFTEADDILPYFDLAILSDEDYPQAETAARNWKHANPKTEIIVTRNVDGADIINEKGVTHIPTSPVPAGKIVDSVGLGDIFGAAVAYHLYKSRDLTNAIEEGHAAALEKLLAPRVY
jgi:sugar/nucleoside kinase (ribokinase family)